MDITRLEDYLFEKGGLKISLADVAEKLLLEQVTNSMFLGEILKRQIELDRQMREGYVDDDSVNEEFMSVVDQISEQATARKNSILADLAYKSDK